MYILLFSVHSPTKVGLGNHGNWFCLVHVSTVFLWGLIDFPEAGELPTQQLSFFAKTSAHLAWRLQLMFIPCVVGEMMQWHQWRERLRDSCHFAYRERIQFERQRDSVTGPPHVGFDALTSAEGDCGAQSTQEKGGHVMSQSRVCFMLVLSVKDFWKPLYLGFCHLLIRT